MASVSNINVRIVLAVIAAVSLFSSCDKLGDTVDSAKTQIRTHLNSQGVYERGNVPEDVSSTSVKGYYDIISGAYRYIVNEDRAGRTVAPEISAGDSISFHFDARIFSNSFDNSTTYYTNIASRIEAISNNNPQFDTSGWPTEPKRIKVGDDNILKAIQSSLAYGSEPCKVGDQVRVFLPPDVAYENKQAGVVPAKSTLVFELTNIEIIP